MGVLRWSDEDLRAYQERRKGEAGKKTSFVSPSASLLPLKGKAFGEGGATEDEEQILLFEWAEVMAWKWPELKWMYHVPNGGSRNGAEAGKLRAMGVKSGVPDVALDVARGGWHGLRIEMKRADGGRLSEAQREWIEHLNAEGYRAVVCAGWQTAARVIEGYLKGGETSGD